MSDGGRGDRRGFRWPRFRRERDPRTAEEVLEFERAQIEDDRPEELKGTGIWVLSHSGGGIRSASFSIGVQQALNSDGLMREFDYLSTVSGGGYAGSALTWGLANRDGHRPEHRFDERRSDADASSPPVRPIDWERDFPFGSDSVGSDGEGSRGNRFLDYLRHHGRYLTPGNGLGGISFLGSVVQGTLISGAVYTLLVMAVMSFSHAACFFSVLPQCETSAAHRVEQFQVDHTTSEAPLTLAELKARAKEAGHAEVASAAQQKRATWVGLVNDAEWIPEEVEPRARRMVVRFWNFVEWVPNLPTALAIGMFGLIGLFAATNSVVSARRSTGSWWYEWERVNQGTLGFLWTLALAFTWLAAVEGIGDFIIWDIVAYQAGYGWAWSASAPAIAAIVSTLSGYARFSQQQEGGAKTAKGSGSSLAIGILAGVFAVTVGAYVVTFMVDGLGTFTAAFVLGAMGLALGILSNINLVGPHAMYRSRLMEAFMPDPRAVRDQRWAPAISANETTLMDIGCSHVRPLHLVNANLILTDSRTAKFRGRGGDNFVLSPFYCGSSATGWFPTQVFNRSYFSRNGVTLATAMAISGAALNPDSGVGGAGPTRGRGASALLTFLNLRLGFWAPNPRLEAPFLSPNFITPGVKGGLLGGDLHEDAAFIQLSDGGHFENLALYEAIRRRAEVIVVTDGGADPDFKFADLANVIERTRVDFGAEILWREGRGPRWTVMQKEIEGLDFPVAERGWAVADVWYSAGDASEAGDPGHPDRPADGTLFYLKTTMVPELPSDLVGYRKANEDFPDESTADQFFSEQQFEAYRELGFQLAHRMIHEEQLIELARRRASTSRARSEVRPGSEPSPP